MSNNPGFFATLTKSIGGSSRKDGERVRFTSEAAAQNYIDRGHHLQPIKKDIKTYGP